MPLAKEEVSWIIRFTAGDVTPSGDAVPGDMMQGPMTSSQNIEEEFRRRRDKEMVKEQALKDNHLAKALAEVEQRKQALREKTQVETTGVDDKGNKVNQKLRDDKGDQSSDEALEVGGNLSGVQTMKFAGSNKTFDPKDQGIKKHLETLTDEVLKLQDIANRLAAIPVTRSVLPKGAKAIQTKQELLFTNEEIGEEIFEPLVRDKVIGETLVLDKWSKTAQMLDGSDKYYLKECKEKGKAPATGAAALAKGTLQVAGQVATTIFSGLGTVKTGQTAMNTAKWSKDKVNQYNEVTNGIVAVLQGGIDFIDQANEWGKSGDFNEDGFEAACNNVSLGIGKIVGGKFGDDNLGGMVSASINGAIGVAKLGAKFKKWAEDPNAPPPVGDVLNYLGTSLSNGFSIVSDLPSAPSDVNWSNLATDLGSAFKVAANAYEANILAAIRKGDWGEVGKFIEDAAAEAGKDVIYALVINPAYNADPSGSTTAYDNQASANQSQQKGEEGIDKAVGGAKGLTGLAPKGKPLYTTKAEEQYAKGKELYDQLQKQAAEKKKSAEDAELAKIPERLKKEQDEYQASLKCLGSKDPKDSEYKSIAKLIEQIDRDRAIWNGLTAMFGGGIGAASGVTSAIAGIASEVAPALKAAGQLVKYLTNLKAAADRLDAWLTWREGRKDAISAVSPYATTIENFIQNQGSQFAHYSIQAAANAIQALLAAGEMSPAAPAFKVAGAAVGAAATLEETIYKFVKQQQLRQAWKDTKEAIDPANKGNRKMRLLVRKINPTLAKYTIAYGALVAEDPIAIDAMNRVGLDRETLTREGDGVKNVKNFLDKLYPDDGTVLVKPGVDIGKVKVPEPKLDSRTWATSFAMWTKQAKMESQNPLPIVANLTIVEDTTPLFDAKPEKAMQARLLDTLLSLEAAFQGFVPLDGEGKVIAEVKTVCEFYADLASAEAMRVKMTPLPEEPKPVPTAVN